MTVGGRAFIMARLAGWWATGRSVRIDNIHKFNVSAFLKRVCLYAICGKMTLTYLQLKPESRLPDISALSPFRSVVVIRETVSLGWQSEVSAWLVRSGCLYMMAWGNECSSWHDSVDDANIEEFNFEEIPEAKFVMTTWHEDEPLGSVFWFAKNCAFHPTVELSNTLILDISTVSREEQFLADYNNA